MLLQVCILGRKKQFSNTSISAFPIQNGGTGQAGAGVFSINAEF